MNKVRRLFRGGGRALALVFAASVAWLLFDMAALRLSSFSELKEEAGREQRERAPGWRQPLPARGGPHRPGPRGLGPAERSQEQAGKGLGRGQWGAEGRQGLGRGEEGGGGRQGSPGERSPTAAPQGVFKDTVPRALGQGVGSQEEEAEKGLSRGRLGAEVWQGPPGKRRPTAAPPGAPKDTDPRGLGQGMGSQEEEAEKGLSRGRLGAGVWQGPPGKRKPTAAPLGVPTAVFKDTVPRGLGQGEGIQEEEAKKGLSRGGLGAGVWQEPPGKRSHTAAPTGVSAAVFKNRLWLPRPNPGKAQSPAAAASAQPSLPLVKAARLAGNTTYLRSTTLLPRGVHSTPRRPPVKLAHSAAPFSSPVTTLVRRPFTQESRGEEDLFQVGLVEKNPLAEFKRGALPAEDSQELRMPAHLPALETGMHVRIKQVTRGLDVQVAKLAASEAAAEQKGASPGATGLGKPSTVVPPAEHQVVLISKEEAHVALVTTQTPQADVKRNFTHRSMEQNVPLITSNNTLTVIVNATKVTSLQASITKTKLVEGAAHQVSLANKAKLREINQSDSANHLAEDIRQHKVLAIDRSLVPRDPKAPGQFGRPAVVPGEKREEAKRRWNEGNFNVYLSDLIPVDRAIEDTRPIGCSDLLVHNDLPTTSIIMCFVDEVWSTLLRSVHSVLNRSPPQYIKEVILVDDFSTKAYLKDTLDQYMAQFPKVRVLHLKERHGLIRARLAGAQIAKGDVLTFLDSHVECNVGWLEPLLDRIHLNRKKVACPVIEVISDKDMSYMTVDSFQRGIFTWPMNFGWKPIPPDVIEKNKIKETDIIRCPVMAGGLFSIDKKYFFELGTYDPGLDVWGGENMEISFKVWMCGGEIEIIPCSRVGHIFRNDNPYSFPKDRVATVERNLARVAEVWLDEYKDIFYGHAYHLIQKNLDVGELSQQKELRRQLQCKSFKWYLDNIYPDLEAPLVKASGLIINIALAKCITVDKSGLTFETCDVNNKNQKFSYTWLRLIQHEDSCVALTDAKGTLGLHPCDKRNNRLKWLHKSLVAFHPELMDHIVLEHLPRATCLEVDQSQKTLRANICSSSNPYQKWQFGHYYAD